MEATRQELALFVSEADRRLRSVEALFSEAIDRAPSDAMLRLAALELHTLKGDAGLVGALDFRAAVHEAESVLFALKHRPEAERSVEPVLKLVDVLMQGLVPHREQLGTACAIRPLGDSVKLVRKVHDTVRPPSAPGNLAAVAFPLDEAEVEPTVMPSHALHRIELATSRLVGLANGINGELGSAVLELQRAVTEASSCPAREIWTRLTSATPAFASAAGK